MISKTEMDRRFIILDELEHLGKKKQVNSIKPLVSVSVATYEQEDFIRECLEGILMQKTNFDFEIVIGEDESNDKTREICKEYAEKYPDKIRLFLRDRKLTALYDSKGQFYKSLNGTVTFLSCRGKYIALCEGDDYWTDPLKLQKQVEFLESNPEFGICFHNVIQLNTFDTSKSVVIPNVNYDLDYTLENYILSNKTATCSIVLKKECVNTIPRWFYKVPFGDLALILLVMNNSNEKGRVLKDLMGVYRIHKGGIHGSFHKDDKSLIKAYIQHVSFTKIISKEFLVEKKYQKIILKKMLNTYHVLTTLYKKENNKLQFYKTFLLVKYYKLKLKFI
ncbi:glycosyltransferase [Flavobacterium sp. NG2]|uniref:glycosyltransferase family 2 protein n=1 Tax=Flavobacterium sp. NG2 TaxID=3097547 RepID=UPI002A811870|nr:glycosyltransferase [Flavobacterium sp. NG2]WPR71615.1 glycosyltransferase [Flavobacterium sp. NG2]